jgi:ferredoxin
MTPPASPSPFGGEGRYVEVRFDGAVYTALRLPCGSRLLEHLTIENSPVLFGCRAGMCGTCLIRVEPTGDGVLDPPDGAEAELLDLIAPGESHARLACQVVLTADVRVAPAGSPAT